MDIVTGHIAVIMSVAILISFVILAIVKRPKVKLFVKLASQIMAVGTVIALYFALETMYGWPWKTTFPSGKYTYFIRSPIIRTRRFIDDSPSER